MVVHVYENSIDFVFVDNSYPYMIMYGISTYIEINIYIYIIYDL
jgi:hypothetical protein